MARLTRKKAKELSILKWQWLYDNPEICWEDDLPENILKQLDGFPSKCALCQFFHYNKKEYVSSCDGCPLCFYDEDCNSWNHYFQKWYCAETNKTRKKYAGLILRIIKDWKV